MITSSVARAESLLPQHLIDPVTGYQWASVSNSDISFGSLIEEDRRIGNYKIATVEEITSVFSANFPELTFPTPSTGILLERKPEIETYLKTLGAKEQNNEVDINGILYEYSSLALSGWLAVPGKLDFGAEGPDSIFDLEDVPTWQYREFSIGYGDRLEFIDGFSFPPARKSIFFADLKGGGASTPDGIRVPSHFTELTIDQQNERGLFAFSIVPVPLPATLWFLGLGLAILARMRRTVS